MVDRLTNLIAIFENPALDFSQEPRRGRRHPRRRLRIPDAALRHRESARARASSTRPPRSAASSRRSSASAPRRPSADTTVYDPTCGSGSLLLKVADEAGTASHALRAGEGRRHQRPRPHEHDPARLPDGRDLAGQHAGRSEVQGRRRQPQDLRLRRRQSAVLRQALEHRPRSRERPVRALRASACRPPSRATTPTCCTSSAR